MVALYFVSAGEYHSDMRLLLAIAMLSAVPIVARAQTPQWLGFGLRGPHQGVSVGIMTGESGFIFSQTGRNVGFWMDALGWTRGAPVGGYQGPGEPWALEELPPLPPIASLPAIRMPEGL